MMYAQSLARKDFDTIDYIAALAAFNPKTEVVIAHNDNLCTLNKTLAKIVEVFYKFLQLCGCECSFHCDNGEVTDLIADEFQGHSLSTNLERSLQARQIKHLDMYATCIAAISNLRSYALRFGDHEDQEVIKGAIANLESFSDNLHAKLKASDLNPPPVVARPIAYGSDNDE